MQKRPLVVRLVQEERMFHFVRYFPVFILVTLFIILSQNKRFQQTQAQVEEVYEDENIYKLVIEFQLKFRSIHLLSLGG
jgi:hypothetical protein